MLYIFCSCLLLCLLSTSVDTQEYITQPVSVNASLDSTVNFTCEATGPGINLVFFIVNCTPASEKLIISKGFTESDQLTINGTIRRSLSAYAQEINNNTNIFCNASRGDIKSDTATLRIQGLLASVGKLSYSYINGSSVLLSWTAPYTLDNVPITGYYINDGFNDITTSNNDTSIVLSTTDPDVCNITVVTISPINGAGIGEPNDISYYYQRVPLIIPNVSIIPVIDGHRLSLNFSVNVNTLCIGEYPNNISVNILNTDDTLISTTSISPQINDQLITGYTSITLPDTINTFIINVSISNSGGKFNNIPSLGFGGVTTINSSIDNCTNISIYWDSPALEDDRVSILYYNLSIYDDITGSLMNTVIVNGTSYWFEDKNLFRNRYTYVITGVNKLGEGISNNKTSFYQRVPRSAVENAKFYMLDYTPDTITIEYYIPVILECTGEAPENATVTIQCGKEYNINDTYLVEYTNQPRDINKTLSLPLHVYQQCLLSVVFSNNAGDSKPLILKLVLQLACSQSDYVDNIDDLRSCDNTPAHIDFIFTPPSGHNCSSINDDYHILIFHHDFKTSRDIQKHPLPEQYNETACLVHLKLSDDVSNTNNNNTLLQVWMTLVVPSSDHYCSNNFTLLVDAAPPDPVIPKVTVNCTGVSVYWSTPYYPSGCPLQYYQMNFNDEIINITNNLSHYSWSDLSHNALYTISISAVNTVGTSTKSNITFITAMNPYVFMIKDYVVIVPGDPVTANFIVTAKVDSNCTFSQPTHLYHNISCDGDIVSPSVNNTVNISNGQIVHQQSLPVVYRQCTAVFIWSNLNSSFSHTITFNTTQLLFIQLYPVTNGLKYTCHYRPNSSLWGCGISVLNNTIQMNDTIQMNETTGSITGLCSDVYNVTKFYLKNPNETHHVIDHNVAVNITGNCDGTSNELIAIILLSSLVPVLVIILLLIGLLIVIIICHKNIQKCGKFSPQAIEEQEEMQDCQSEQDESYENEEEIAETVIGDGGGGEGGEEERRGESNQTLTSITNVNEPIESDSASNNRNGDDNLQANLDEEVESKDEYFSEEAADEIILNENKEDGEEADDIMEDYVVIEEPATDTNHTSKQEFVATNQRIQRRDSIKSTGSNTSTGSKLASLASKAKSIIAPKPGEEEKHLLSTITSEDDDHKEDVPSSTDTKLHFVINK